MKKKRGIQSFLILLMAICMVVPFSVKAATQTQDGLTVSLTTDKENYAQDEDIQVILSVTNEGNDPVSNISLENIIPEGYEISDGSSQEMQLDMLEIGETVNLETVYSPSLEEDTEPTEDTEIQPGQSDKNAGKYFYPAFRLKKPQMFTFSERQPPTGNGVPAAFPRSIQFPGGDYTDFKSVAACVLPVAFPAFHF